jgi:hypothetical protein
MRKNKRVGAQNIGKMGGENIFAELTENRLTGGAAGWQNLYIPLRVGGG